MLELNGKYATAKVFTDVVDNASISQVITLLNQPYVQGSRVRMMPDIHAGAGCTIGTTMTVTDKICPNLVGVDIGCGMEVIRLKEKYIEPVKLDVVIREHIPSGFAVRSSRQGLHRYAGEIDLQRLCCARYVNLDRAYQSIGTLGGGNHFIEANRDENGAIYIVVHSGSRHLGVEIANYYQEAAWRSVKDLHRDKLSEFIDRLKREGRAQEIPEAIKQFPRTEPIPKPLAYVEGELFDWYIHDMKIAQRFADLNRRAMVDCIVKNMGLHVVEQFTTVHNYIDMDSMILRKGAVSARAGEKLIIPINMRDGSLICTGLGNEDWNCSAPHGAGRLMSRAQAKQSFTVSEFKKQMKGIYTTSVNQGTLDECPMAYKNMDDIVNNIGPTARVDAVIKPIYNFKGGAED